MDLNFFKSENRIELYKKHEHISNIELKKYTFDKIDSEFTKFEKKNYSDTKIRIRYIRYIPQVSNFAILNCANSHKPNAGYKIDNNPTQEGQLFNDTDIFTADFDNMYPFDFSNELLYAKNVTFHNCKDKQWDEQSLRKNDMIIAASKRLKHSRQTEKLEPVLERTIDSVFKVSLIKSTLLLCPIGCGVFRNDPSIVAKLFVKIIKKLMFTFREITMIIYDPNRSDKKFNDCFISELNEKWLNYRIN